MPEVELSAGTIEYEDTGGERAGDRVRARADDGRLAVAPRRRGAALATTAACCRRCRWAPIATRCAPTPTSRCAGSRRSSASSSSALDLREMTLAMNDWGGPQLLIGGAHDERIARLVLCSCEAFDNVPPKGAAQAAAVHRADPRRARRRAAAVSLRPPAQAADDLRAVEQAAGATRGDGPLVRPDARAARSAATCASTCAAPRRAAASCSPRPRRCAAFDRPALVAWASEDRLMPREHGRRLAELLPQGRLVEIADSYTLIPEDQPQVLAATCASCWTDESAASARR